jgi:hypothetical protein
LKEKPIDWQRHNQLPYMVWTELFCLDVRDTISYVAGARNAGVTPCTVKMVTCKTYTFKIYFARAQSHMNNNVCLRTCFEWTILLVSCLRSPSCIFFVMLNA